MHFLETIQQSDPYTWVSYAGLAGCLFWLIAQTIAMLRFRARLGFHSRMLAAAISGRPVSTRLPRAMRHLLSQLQMPDVPQRLLEFRMLLKNRLHRSGVAVKLSAPAFGVAGTMSGAWAFLADFDRSSLGVQPSIQGLSDATTTTWIGLMLMVATIFLMNKTGGLVERLMLQISACISTSRNQLASTEFSVADSKLRKQGSTAPMGTVDRRQAGDRPGVAAAAGNGGCRQANNKPLDA